VLAVAAAGCGLIYAVLVWRWLNADERNDLLEFVPDVFRQRVMLWSQRLAARSGGGA
jgi:hypothetical protein